MTTPLLALLTATFLALDSPASGWSPPLTTGWEQVLRTFERPDDRFAAGHRGIDIAAPWGPMRAIGLGRVAFVGDVAHTPTVSTSTTIHRGHRRTNVGPWWPKATGWRWDPYRHPPHTATAPAAAHLGLRRPAWEARDAMTDPHADPCGSSDARFSNL